MKKLSIYPFGRRVIVKQQALETITPGGIVLQLENEKAEKAANIQGTLMAIGLGSWDDYDEPWAEVGQEVYFAKYAGKQIFDTDGEEYLIMNAFDLLCGIEEVEND